MCGEKCTDDGGNPLHLGSPPHVRGKVTKEEQNGTGMGITPACAGKRSTTQIFRHLHGDHPRMCGEKSTKKRSGNKAIGSPPHVRGKD